MRLLTLCLSACLASAALPALAAEEVDYKKQYETCINQGDIDNTAVFMCASITSHRAKAEITRHYNALHARWLPDAPESAQRLETTQKAWIQYRDGQCALATSYVGSPMASYCPMELNIARAEELRLIYMGNVN